MYERALSVVPSLRCTGKRKLADFEIKILFVCARLLRLMLRERRSTSVLVAAGAASRAPHRPAGGVGAQLPASRRSDSRSLPSFEAAWESRSKRDQIFCDWRCPRTHERSWLAGQSHQHDQPTLAAAE